MTKPAEYLRLSFERAAERLILLEHAVVSVPRRFQPLIDGEIDLAHTAFTDHRTTSSGFGSSNLLQVVSSQWAYLKIN